VPHISSGLAQRKLYFLLDKEDTISDVLCLRESKAIHNVHSNRDFCFVSVSRLRCTERINGLGILPNSRGHDPRLTNF
jgi:hypothetical protein